MIRRTYIAIGSILVAISASVAFTVILYGALTPDRDTGELAPETASAETVTSSPAVAVKTTSSSVVPSELAIPSLGVDAKIEEVGVNSKGAIGTPSTFQTVAWFTGSSKPGSPGMSIIDGHVNNGLGLAGVFTDLADIQIGAHISVSDSKGDKVDFIVTGTSTIDYEGHLSDLNVLGQVSAPELALVTCEGQWVAASKTYDHRIVVLAVEEK